MKAVREQTLHYAEPKHLRKVVNAAALSISRAIWSCTTNGPHTRFGESPIGKTGRTPSEQLSQRSAQRTAAAFR